jgi:hypothetical protein
MEKGPEIQKNTKNLFLDVYIIYVEVQGLSDANAIQDFTATSTNKAGR